MQHAESDGKTTLVEPLIFDDDDQSATRNSDSPTLSALSRESLLGSKNGDQRQLQQQRVFYSSTTPSQVKINNFTNNNNSGGGGNRVSDSSNLAMMEAQQDVGYQRQKGDEDQGSGFCGIILTIVSYIIFLCTFPLSLCFTVKVVQEYERAVIFRLGRLLAGGARGPGIFFILPCLDNYIKVDLRTVTFDVPPQEILTKDSVTVAVDAVVYYRTANPTMSVTNVEDAAKSTKLLAATTLRNVLGTKTLGEVLSDRDHICNAMQGSLDLATDPWGIKVERVEVKDVRLPVQLQRAMAAEAEAARDARAKVISAEGEQKASRALKEAADVLNESPSALQLRYLQTLAAISAEHNSTIVFPLPMELLKPFTG